MRSRFKSACEVNAMLGADLHDARHVRAGGIRKLGGAPREERLETRGRGGDQHAQWHVADVLERMHGVFRHEGCGPGPGLMPSPIR